jgi:hypothetical protein
MAKRAAKTPKQPPPIRRTCGTMAVHHTLLEQHPEYRIALGNLEMATRARLSAGAFVMPPQEVVIPVVVHVVFNAKSDNISQAQIDSQIATMNGDYSAANKDKANAPPVWKGLITDTMIRFALATKDPNGKPTKGVTRTHTKSTSFSDDNAVKSSATGGADPWPSSKYLNLWVCTLSGGLLGYAQFPGSPPATDGVVILNTAFGTSGTATVPFNLGRSATHEVGHWLNLRHIWGDTEDCSGSDFVDDTPSAQHPNFGKPKFPHVSCSNGPNGDMFVNYMDYVDDDTMVMFTAGQVVRMHATLAGPRNSIVASGKTLTS